MKRFWQEKNEKMEISEIVSDVNDADENKTTKWSKMNQKADKNIDPSTTPSPQNDLYEEFTIKFYVLDRQGRRLPNALKPHDTPPSFCELKDRNTLEASAKSDVTLTRDTPISILDKEIESKLLKHGRPIPCQIGKNISPPPPPLPPFVFVQFVDTAPKPT
jgi:hypothetical protein